ncbi:MAG: antitoxin [Oscillospiraceae bacterium]|nr:antitoxin [Oscillospiraceae bacterium]
MGKTSSESKNKYNAKAYDRVSVMLKKGQREIIADYASSQGLSLNGYINKLISEDMGEALTNVKPDAE